MKPADWTPPPMLADFARRAAAILAKEKISEKRVLPSSSDEPASVIYVAEPAYRYSDTNIEISMKVNAELAAQDVYHATGLGRLCIPSALVQDSSGQSCLVRRLHTSWQPLAALAELRGDAWRLPLEASLLRRDVARIALLDFVLANDGRHGWSAFLDREGGRFLSGDHGQCFGRGASFGECFRRAPLGDLHLTNDEADEARRWWVGAEPLAMEALARWTKELGPEMVAAATARSRECSGPVSSVPPSLPTS